MCRTTPSSSIKAIKELSKMSAADSPQRSKEFIEFESHENKSPTFSIGIKQNLEYLQT